jgi:hypothetical protein
MIGDSSAGNSPKKIIMDNNYMSNIEAIPENKQHLIPQ